MDKAATKMMGEEVRAGAPVMPRGTAKGIAAVLVGAEAAGAVGAMAAGRIANRKKPTTPGEHHGMLFMAVGPEHLAFFELKRGLIRNKVGKLLVMVPRSEVTRFEMEPKGSLTSPLEVELASGDIYQLEVPRVQRGKVQRIQAELAA